MALIIAILVTGLLFAGFLMLTVLEARTGVRVLGGVRSALDRRVAHAVATLRRADIGALFFHSARALLEYGIRLGVHGILVGVRTIERFLVRVARDLRNREEMLLSSQTFLDAWVTRVKRRLGKKDDSSVE